MISAACHHVIFFASARKITSCTFIVRSIAACVYENMPSMLSYPRRLQSGHFTCYLIRTYHVLTTRTKISLDISRETSNPSCFSLQSPETKEAILRVRVFYHDKCFDGASSAALFSRFYRERVHGDAEFVYSGLLHRAGSLFDEKQFDGDENVIVDFKY